jgi:gamma-glutamylcyclotransferase (GGCT)/AIG2-like uncharacterized protein YtfP
MNKQQRKDFKECNRLIVYGTLRKGMGNHQHYLASSKFLGEYEVPNFIMWTDRGSTIPFVSVTSDEGHSIIVEAYEIESFETFRDLDTLEGHPDFYKRILIKHDNEDYWIYIIPKEDRYYYSSFDNNIIEDGDYVMWNLNRKKMNSFVRR